ncbi:hypothetical protein VPH35_103654 [Triticum aestivum]|uniref:Uncharacterized protein n=2 Tax=Triticum urartu TaxID=4572 RepID=A0A8R7QQ51_TRIUA
MRTRNARLARRRAKARREHPPTELPLDQGADGGWRSRRRVPLPYVRWCLKRRPTLGLRAPFKIPASVACCLGVAPVHHQGEEAIYFYYPLFDSVPGLHFVSSKLQARCLWNCLPPLQLQRQRQRSKEGRLGRARKGKDDHAAGAGGVHGGHGVGGARRVGVGVPAGRQRDRPRHACRGDRPLRCGVKNLVPGPPF